MKKGMLCILLAIVMIVPLFTACGSEADLSGEEVSIYTLYTIVEESTTKEAVIEVELALNRILYHRLGVILDLVMVTEDEYDNLIEDKFAEMEELALEKKNKKKDKNKDKSAASSDEEVSKDIMTGDKVLEMLEEGKEIVLDEPRLDIFLVRGYDEYYELASTNKLAALDEKLNNEAKAIKSYVHSTLLNAAKVDNKIYGIPVNNAIGEYSYFVFDKELLDEHEIDPNTISSLEDLEGYLEMVKTSNPDVVPLKSLNKDLTNTNVNFLSQNGFPAIINSGMVEEAYSSTKLRDYLSMITRYKALGYIGDEIAEGEEDSNRYAVRVETGDKTELMKSYPEDKYTYALFSKPIATNEGTIENIFCVSEYVVSNELTDVMEIVTTINTDAEVMNILTYGVEKVHYDLDDNNEVVRLNDNYMINPDYAGNCFITYTVAEDNNPEKWNDAIKQNNDVDLERSLSLGFTQSLTKFKYKDGDKEIEIYEPDYIKIINKVVDEKYPALMSGTAVLDLINYDEIYAQAELEVITSITNDLNTLYEDNVLKPQISKEKAEQVTEEQGEAIYAAAEKYIMDSATKHAKEKAVKELAAQLRKDDSSLSSTEAKKLAEKQVTEEMIAAQMEDAEKLQEKINNRYETKLQEAIDEVTESIVGSEEYKLRLEVIKSSDAYQKELAENLEYDAPRQIKNKVITIINEQIGIYTDSIIAAIDEALGKEIEAFIAEYSEVLNMDRDAMLEKMKYIGVVKEEESADGSDTSTDTSDAETSDTSDTSDAEGEETEKKGPLYDSWYEFVFEAKIKTQYYAIFGNPADKA